MWGYSTLNLKKDSYPASVELRGTTSLFVKYNSLGEGEEKTEEYPLVQVTAEELIERRLEGKPGFVLKKGKDLFYTEIPATLHFLANDVLGKHYCACNCKRLSAASDFDGGCAKVRDLSPEAYMKEGYEKREAVIESKRIEKYDFILLGFECFNTRFASWEPFIVCKCTHYKLEERGERPSAKSLERMTLALAQNLWEEVDSMDQVRAIMNKGY